MEKPTNLKFEIRSFTSEEIDELLERSPNFRHLRHSRRDKLIREMRLDRWRCDNGEVVIFDEKGLLLDGQHRLAAASIYQRETDHTVWFAVVTGASRAAERTVDTGDQRKFIDFLQNEAVSNRTIVAAIVNAHMKVEAAGRRAPLSAVASSVTVKDAGEAGNKSVNVKFTPGEMVDYFKRNRKAIEKWGVVGARLRQAGIPHSALAVSVGYQLSRVDAADAEEFFEFLRTGSGMKAGDPVLVLRNRLLAAAAEKSKRQNPLWVAALIVQAWGFWRRGELVDPQKLRWRGSGPRAQEFPSHLVDRDDG